ncbi:MAG: hypothetical protein RJQ04_14195 [Longimicrobiales bacterium]
MLSSTSSSRLPEGRWGRTLVLAAVLTLAAGAAIETVLRAQGFRPGFPESPGLWSYHRARAVGTEPVVLLGFSRMQLGVDPAVLEEEFGRPVLQLAVNATSPMPILADLAADERFAGTVWISVLEGDLFEHQGEASAYVRHFRENPSNLNRELNRDAARFLTANLAMRSSQARLLAWWESWLRGLPNDAPYVVMRADRYRAADYQAHADLPGLRDYIRGAWDDFLDPWAEWAERPDAPQIFADSVAMLRQRVEAIEERGGEVVLIRLPVSGPLRDREYRLFPREDYWEYLVGETGATAVHFEDYEEFAGLSLPDDSHLDARDAPAFTRSLARIVQEHSRR